MGAIGLTTAVNVQLAPGPRIGMLKVSLGAGPIIGIVAAPQVLLTLTTSSPIAPRSSKFDPPNFTLFSSVPTPRFGFVTKNETVEVPS